MKKINRKEFLKKTAVVGMGSMLFPQIKINMSKKRDIVRLGFIGTGLRGQWLLDLASKRQDVLIPAICDIDQNMINRTLKILKRNEKEEPNIYNNGDDDFLNLLKRDDLDAVIIATPW